MSVATKRKHVTHAQKNSELRTPEEDEYIVKLLAGRGHNLHLVVDTTGEEFLVSMPPKFRKAVWVKRGDYLLVKPIVEGMKVKAEITNILDAEYIKFLKNQDLWPNEFTKKDCDKMIDGGNPNYRKEAGSTSNSEDHSSDGD